MKKLISTALLAFGFALTAHSQTIPKNALGLRLGDNDGFGGELSYQRGIGDNNRLEFDLGWRDNDNVDAFKLVGLYQWIWNIEGGFNWYAGVGAGVGSWSYDGPPGPDQDGSFFLVAGDIGIEYVFDIPLQLSLDFRPEFYTDDEYRDDLGLDIALGIRFTF